MKKFLKRNAMKKMNESAIIQFQIKLKKLNKLENYEVTNLKLSTISNFIPKTDQIFMKELEQLI